MKQIQLITAIVLLGLFAACSQDEDPAVTEEAVAVEFSPSIAGATLKTTGDGSQWVVGDQIGIYMTPAGDILANATDKNIAYKAVDASANSGFTPVDANQTIHYPRSGNVDFVAYYPYGTVTAGNVYTVSTADQSDPAKIDLLYAETADIAASKTPVALAFNHLLSKITLNVKLGVGMDLFTENDITAVSFAGMPVTAELDLQSGALTAGADLTQTFNPLKAAAPATGYAASYTALAVPQEADAYTGRKVTFTVAGTSYVWNIPDAAAFDAATRHAYEITINSTGITASAGSITAWAGAADSPIEGVGGIYYKVGDYYPNPTNAATAIGVVFWVDPADSRHGKIVSLDEKTAVMWADFYATIGASDLNNGRINIKIIESYIAAPANGVTWANFPAFDWIHSVKNGGKALYSATATGIWYVPAETELKELDTVSATVNISLSAAGATALSDVFYWTSSEYYDFETSHFKSFGLINKRDGNDNNRVRGILAF